MRHRVAHRKLGRVTEHRISNRATDTPCLVPLGFQPPGDLEDGGWRIQDGHFQRGGLVPVGTLLGGGE